MQASAIAGIAWSTVYAILAILQADDVNAFVTNVGVAVIGAALGLLGGRSRDSLATVDTNRSLTRAAATKPAIR
jgi:hypothetical protein